MNHMLRCAASSLSHTPAGGASTTEWTSGHRWYCPVLAATAPRSDARPPQGAVGGSVDSQLRTCAESAHRGDGERGAMGERSIAAPTNRRANRVVGGRARSPLPTSREGRRVGLRLVRLRLVRRAAPHGVAPHRGIAVASDADECERAQAALLKPARERLEHAEVDVRPDVDVRVLTRRGDAHRAQRVDRHVRHDRPLDGRERERITRRVSLVGEGRVPALEAIGRHFLSRRGPTPREVSRPRGPREIQEVTRQKGTGRVLQIQEGTREKGTGRVLQIQEVTRENGTGRVLRSRGAAHGIVAIHVARTRAPHDLCGAVEAARERQHLRASVTTRHTHHEPLRDAAQPALADAAVPKPIGRADASVRFVERPRVAELEGHRRVGRHLPRGTGDGPTRAAPPKVQLLQPRLKLLLHLSEVCSVKRVEAWHHGEAFEALARALRAARSARRRQPNHCGAADGASILIGRARSLRAGGRSGRVSGQSTRAGGRSTRAGEQRASCAFIGISATQVPRIWRQRDGALHHDGCDDEEEAQHFCAREPIHTDEGCPDLGHTARASPLTRGRWPMLSPKA
eukprot:2346921-Prymnesium_polylepis.1